MLFSNLNKSKVLLDLLTFKKVTRWTNPQYFSLTTYLKENGNSRIIGPFHDAHNTLHRPKSMGKYLGKRVPMIVSK